MLTFSLRLTYDVMRPEMRRRRVEKQRYVSVPAFARMLGLSRIAVYKWVKAGRIEATKVGKNYAIPGKYVNQILGKDLSSEAKKEIRAAVRKTILEYGDVLKRLGRE